MPRKHLNHPETFRYMGGEMTFKSQRSNNTPVMKKCSELHFGCKVGDQESRYKLGPSFLLCNVCKASYRMGTWVMPNAVHHIHGLE
jgi:hypothetical protein